MYFIRYNINPDNKTTTTNEMLVAPTLRLYDPTSLSSVQSLSGVWLFVTPWTAAIFKLPTNLKCIYLI